MAGRDIRAERPLFEDRDALQTLCKRHHVLQLALFGSRLSGRAVPTSDVDLLVRFKPGMEPGLIGLELLAQALSGLLGGLTVDLRTRDDLSDHFREHVERESHIQYAA